MSVWDRIGRAAKGLGEAITGTAEVGAHMLYAPAGFVADIATSPWNNDAEYNGVLNTIQQRAATRFGADVGRGLGKITGGVDQAAFGVDEALGAPLSGLSSAYSWLWSNVVSQPLTTGILAGRRPGEQGFNAWDLMLGFDPSRVGTSYKEAEHTSPGRAATAKWAQQLGVRGADQYDLTTASGVNQAVQDLPAGSLTSGAVDFAANVFLDPTLIAGKGVALAKGARVSVQQGRIEATIANNRTDRFLSTLFSKDTPATRAAWLARNKTIADSTNPEAPKLIHLLANAEDPEDGRMILRTAMTKDPLAEAALRVRSADSAAQLDYLTDKKIPLVQKMLDGETNTFQKNWGKKNLAQLRSDAHASTVVARREQMLADVAGTLERKPVVGATQRLGDHVKTDLWQPSVYNIPIRVYKAVSTIRPGVVDYHDSTSWINLQRFLDQSGIDRETKGRLLLDWAEAADKGVNEAGMRTVLEKAESAATSAAADRAGVSREVADMVLKHGQVRRSEVFARLTDPMYSTVSKDGKRIDTVLDDGSVMRVPLDVSQNENYHSLLDLTDMEHVLGRYKTELAGREADLPVVLDAIQRRKPVAQAFAGLEEIGQAINNVWKPAQLLRLGYTARNVMDEGLRTIAVHGVLSYLPMTGSALKARHFENVAARTERAMERLSQKAAVGRASPVELDVLDAMKKRADKDNLEADALDAAEGADPAVRQQMERLFSGQIRLHGYNVDDLYGHQDSAPLRALVSSRDSVRQMTTDQGTLINRSRTAASDWVEKGPLEDGYKQAWLRAVNDQILNGPVFSKVLEGRSDSEIVAWLRSAEGKQVRRRMGIRGGNLNLWAREARMHVEKYLPTQELQDLAGKRKTMKFSDLEKAVPEATLRPTVHAEELKVANGASIPFRMMRQFIDKSMDALGSAPNDVLVRHPFANLSYRQKLSQLLRDYDPGHTGTLDEATLRRLQDRARVHALRQTRETMYELSEQPNIARSLRFVVPFYGAWHDMITTWGHLFADDPSRLARGLQLWNMPDKAGWIQTNEFGDKVMIMPVPEWARKHIPGAKSLGSMAFTKASILPMTAGQNPLIPGAGYMVAIPAAAFARDRPDVADSIKFILPFGPGQDWLDQFLPAAAKRVRSESSEDQAFTATTTKIFADLVYERNIGKNKMSDTELMDEAKRRAKSFYNLRTFVNLTFPAIPQYQSPYQFYVDRAKEYRDKFGADGGPDGQSWESTFIRDYGDSYWPFTLAMSKATVAVQPTEQGFHAFEQMKDLIGRYPDYSGLFVGDDVGNGKFSRAVYEWQFRTPAGTGTTAKIRQALDPAAALRDINQSQGWEKWIQASRWIDAQMQARGLSSLADPRAGDLANLKTGVRLALQQQFPDWYKDYTTYDTEKAANVVSAVKATMADPRLKDQPGWGSLRDYVSTRDRVLGLLRARWQQGGSLNLQAKENGDVALAWGAYVNNLKATDLAFSSIYARYLDNDTLQRGV